MNKPTLEARVQHRLRLASIHREPNAIPESSKKGREGRTTRNSMAEGLDKDLAAYSVVPASLPEGIIGEEALYRSALKCRKGVGRKYSVQSYSLNIIENTIKLSRELVKEKYKEGPIRKVSITYPKPRTALSICFRDRVYQRSINDNSLYPQMARKFIYNNFACQKGKGTEAALFAMKRMLRSAYLHYGTANFYIFSADVKGYYDSMIHSITDDMFKSSIDQWTFLRVQRTLNRQYKGEMGYNPGSQMVQIAGISYLNPLDHYIKEKMLRRYYIRYMDDFHILCGTKSETNWIWGEIEGELNKVGMDLHPTKTKIHKAKDGVVFLGFLFKVTDTGKVLMFRDPKRVKEIKRRLRRLTNKIIRNQDYSIGDLDISYKCVKACMEKGNSKRLLRSMEQLYRKLKGEIQNAKRNDNQGKAAA